MRIDKKHKKENNYNEPAHVRDEKKEKQETENKKKMNGKTEEKTK